MTTEHEIVSRDEWVARRRELLAQEKQLTRLRDELSAKRRALPWVRVDPQYRFESAGGTRSLRELFGPHSQLAMYHFMFGPDWEVGCKSCSFWADNFDHIGPHLAARDVAFVAASRAPLPRLQAFAERMGWSFDWVSSLDSPFNHDFGVSFTPEELAVGEVPYNYATRRTTRSELPGISVFVRDGDAVFHSYSSYGRGVEAVNGAFAWLDLVPKGRDETDGPMAWLKLRDQYGR